MLDETIRRSEPTRTHQPPADPTRQAMPQVPAAEVVATVPTRRPDLTEEKRKLPLGVIGGGVAGLLALIAVVMLGWYALYAARGMIYPGVAVGEIQLSGMTTAQAQATLAAEWTSAPVLTVSDGERKWPGSPSDFGLALDSAATAQRAADYGHSSGLLGGLVDFYEAAFGGYQVEAVVTVDEGAARLGLEAWADEIVNTEPQNATIRIVDGEVIAVPGVAGKRLDVDATLTALSFAPGQALQGGTLTLITDAVPPAIADAEPFVTQAEAMLSQPLLLSAYDPIRDERVEVTVAAEEVAGWLSIEESASGPVIGVDADGALDEFAALDEQLGESRYPETEGSAEVMLAALQSDHVATLDVGYTESAYTVVAGDTLYRIAWKTGVPYWRILEANPGIEDRGVSVGEAITIPPLTDQIPLPVVEGKRVVVDISEQRTYLYQDGELWREYIISTGITDSPTQPGIFQMQLFDEYAYAGNWDLYMPEFIGIYEAWPGFMNGFHALPILSNGNRLWGDVLGQPASYGCIILSIEDSAEMWAWGEAGVIVEIRE